MKMQDSSVYCHLLDTYGVTLTPAQFGEVTHRHPAHVRRLCKSGEIPAVQIGERWVIPTAKAAAILEGVELDG